MASRKAERAARAQRKAEIDEAIDDLAHTVSWWCGIACGIIVAWALS